MSEKNLWFEIQAFALNPNRTTDTTASTGNDLSPEMKTFYEKDLIEMAEAELIFDQFAEKYPIPKNNGKTIEFRKFTPLGKALTPLTEATTPNGQSLDVSAITATVAQYGGYVTLSDLLKLTTIDNIIVQTTKLIASQAGRTLNTVTRNAIDAGTNVIYAPNGTTAISARASINTTSLLTLDVIRMASLKLRRYNAPTFDGSYVCIVHPDVAMDVRRLSGWVDIAKYGDPQRIFKGEIGMIENIRFIENTEAEIIAEDSTGGSENCNVYCTNFIAKGAYATTELEGGGLEMIVKQNGSAGTEDPLNMRSTIGWKATKVSKILIPEYLVRVESTATDESSAILN